MISVELQGARTGARVLSGNAAVQARVRRFLEIH